MEILYFASMNVISISQYSAIQLDMQRQSKSLAI